MIITKFQVEPEFTPEDLRELRKDREILRAMTKGRKAIKHDEYPNRRRKLRGIVLETILEDGAHVMVYAERDGFIVKNEHPERQTVWTDYPFKQAA